MSPRWGSTPRLTDRRSQRDSDSAEFSLSLQSTEELVDGQSEPVGSAGGPGPWRDSAGVVTQLIE
jgi:hypothetical protein